MHGFKPLVLGSALLCTALAAPTCRAAERGMVLNSTYACLDRDDFETFAELASSRSPEAATQYMTAKVALLRCRSLLAGTPVLVVQQNWAGPVCVQPPDGGSCLWTYEDAIGER